MNFLNPLILYGLIAAGLPLLIHFITRRKLKDVPFPSIEFLERIKITRMRRLKLKQIIVLILRTLIIAAIVLAFARPALRSVFRGNAATTAVMIIDNSASMRYISNGETIYNIAIRKAKEIAGTMTEKDALGIIFTGGRDSDIGVATFNKNSLAETLSASGPTWTSHNVIDSFNKALNFLNEKRSGNKELYYITDGASSSFPDSLGITDKFTRLFIVVVSPEDRKNNVITSAEVTGSFLSVGRPITINASGISDMDSGDIPLELMINGERKDMKTVSPEGKNLHYSFTYTPETPGCLSFCLSLDDNGFLPGELYRFVLDIPVKKNVLIAGEKEQDFYYLRKALTGTVDNFLFNVEESQPIALTEEKIDRADVVILSDISGLSEKTVKYIINSVIQKGTGLIFFPPANIENSVYANMILRDVFIANYKSTVGSGEPTGSGYKVDFTDDTSPAGGKVSEKGNYEKPKVFSFHRFEYSGNMKTEGKLADGSPALGTTKCGKGTAVLFSFNLLPENTDFTMTGIFAPVIIGLVRSVSGENEQNVSFDTGQDVKIYFESDITGKSAVISDEDGMSKSYEISYDDKGGYIDAGVQDKPGFYSIFADGAEKRRFCVNVPVNEKIFEPAYKNKIEKVCKKTDYRVIYDNNGINSTIGKERYGTEMFIPLLLIAGILMVIEMAISRKA